MNNEWQELSTLMDVAAAQAAGYEIERLRLTGDGNDIWCEWEGRYWSDTARYRARPRRPKMKQVRMLCLTNGKTLVWNAEDIVTGGLIRVPNLDYIIEIPE